VPYYGGLANEAVGSEDWLARQAEGSRVPRCGPHNKSPGPANRSCRQSAAVLPAQKVSREPTSPGRPGRRAAPAGGPNGGHSRLSLDRLTR
jgi:hypothetical protein